MQKIIFPIITEYELKLPFYVAGVGCYHQQEHIIRPRGYPNLQWIQCRFGKGIVTIQDITYNIGVGQGILLFPNIPHEYYAVQGSWIVDWIIIGGMDISNFLYSAAGIQTSGVYYVSKPENILEKIDKILHIEQSGTSIKSLESSKIAYEILIDIALSTSMNNNFRLDHRYSKIKPLTKYIETNYNRPISLTELSEIAHLTPQYLCSLFKKLTRLRISEYINLVRIKKSKEHLLRNKGIAIKEIAHMSGYEDVSYYCSVFKKTEHMTPKEFQRLHT